MRMYDTPAGYGDYPSGLTPEAIGQSILERHVAAQSLIADDHELLNKLLLGDNQDSVELAADDIEVEPSDEKGKFLVRFKERFKDEVTEHKVRTALVTGAAVLACAASIRPIKKRVGSR